MKIKAKAALTAAAFSAAAVMSFSGCENEVASGVYGPPPDLDYNNTATEIQDTEWTSGSEAVSQNESESDDEFSEENSDKDDFDPDYNITPTVYGPPMEE